MNQLCNPIGNFKQDITPYQGSSQYLVKIKQRQSKQNLFRQSTPNLKQSKSYIKKNLFDNFFQVSIQSNKLLSSLKDDKNNQFSIEYSYFYYQCINNNYYFYINSITNIEDVSQDVKKYFDTYYSKNSSYCQKREQLEKSLHIYKQTNYQKYYKNKQKEKDVQTQKQPINKKIDDQPIKQKEQWQQDYQELLNNVTQARKPKQDDLKKLNAFQEYQKLSQHNQLKKEKPLLYTVIEKIIKDKIYDDELDIEMKFNQLKQENKEEQKEIQKVVVKQNNQQSRRLFRVKQFQLEKRNKSEPTKHQITNDQLNLELTTNKSNQKQMVTNKTYSSLLQYYQSLKGSRQKQIIDYNRKQQKQSNILIDFYNNCRSVEKKNVMSRQEYKEKLNELTCLSREYENVYEKVTSDHPIKLSDIADRQQPHYRLQLQQQQNTVMNLKNLLYL